MEHREARRFKLRFLLSITRSGLERVNVPGLTKDISSSGVLFTTERAPVLGGPIEYIITLNHDGPQLVNLRCVGRVVRSDRLGPFGDEAHPGFQVAVTLERYEFVRTKPVLADVLAH